MLKYLENRKFYVHRLLKQIEKLPSKKQKTIKVLLKVSAISKLSTLLHKNYLEKEVYRN